MKTFVQTLDVEQADQQMKYAEVMAVAGGVTAVQGSPSSNTDAWDTCSHATSSCNFGGDGIHTKVTTLESDYTGSHITSGNSSGSLNAWTSIFPKVSMNQAVLNSIFSSKTTSWSANWLLSMGSLTSAEFQKMGKLVPTLHGLHSQTFCCMGTQPMWSLWPASEFLCTRLGPSGSKTFYMS